MAENNQNIESLGISSRITENFLELFSRIKKDKEQYVRNGKLYAPTQFCIYFIVNLVNFDYYIGCTADLTRRRKNHFKALRHSYHKNIKLQNAVNKYGLENFEFYPAEYLYVNPISDKKVIGKFLAELETEYIRIYKPHYNIVIMGTNGLGTNHREAWGDERYEAWKKEHINRIKNHPRRLEINRGISLSRKGKTFEDIFGERAEEMRYKAGNAFRGKKRPEFSEHISKIQKGRILSEKTKQKISSSLTGRRLPAEVVAKVAAAARGKKRSQQTKDNIKNALRDYYKNNKSKRCKEVEILDNTGDVIKTFSDTKSAAEFLGVDLSNVSRACTLPNRRTGGYFVRYKK